MVVAGTLVRTDRAGRFETRFRARGRVSLHAGQPCGAQGTSYGADAELVLDGRGSYEVELRAEADGCE